jgi:hypothetical protein
MPCRGRLARGERPQRQAFRLSDAIEPCNGHCKGGSRTVPTWRVVGLLAFASAVLPPVASAARTFALGPVGAIRAAWGGAVLCMLERRTASIS